MAANEDTDGKAQLAKKMDYMRKLIGLMEEYPRYVLVTCDNIGSSHLQKIRTGLREIGAVLLMGKNVCSTFFPDFLADLTLLDSYEKSNSYEQR